MRVTIKRNVCDDGIIRKKIRHEIIVSVEFTEAEKHIIETAGLTNKTFYELNRVGEQRQPVPIHWLLPYKKGDASPAPILASCLDEGTANLEEQQIREALKKIKEAIEYHSTPRKAEDTFEL